MENNQNNASFQVGGSQPATSPGPSTDKTTTQIADTNADGRSLTIKKLSEYLLLLMALTVIVSLLFGLDTLGMIGIAVFFVYGFCIVVYEMLKPIIKAYKAKNYVSTVLISLIMATALWFLGSMLYVAYLIVTLMLGFWEINS